MSVEQLAETALRLAEECGWHIFPITRGGKEPAIPTAHPKGDRQRGACRGECGRDGHGFHDATTEPPRLARWWDAYPLANVGVSCGPSRLVVIDCDAHHHRGDTRVIPQNVLRNQGDVTTPTDIVDGVGVFRWLARRAGADLEALDTLVVTTPTGGRHYYFTAPDGLTVKSGAGLTSSIGWQVDIRATNGYVVTAPSARPDGTYTATAGVPVRPLPSWLVQTLQTAGKVPELQPRKATTAPAGLPRRALTDTRGRHRYLSAAISGELQRVLDTPEGGRNHALNRAAFSLGQLVAGNGLDQTAISDALLAAAVAAGLKETEAELTIDSGLSAGVLQPRSATT